MSELSLEQVVKELAAVAVRMSPADLELPWIWNSYDSDGVRLVFFRTAEELKTLAVRVRHARLSAGQAPTQAQSILAYDHAAYRDVQAAVLGLDEAGFTTPPAEGEWPVRRTLAHILNADMGFYAVVSYALARHRSGDGRPGRIPDEAWEPILGLNDAQETSLMDSPAEALLAYYADFHARVLADFSTVSAAELEMDSYYWEEEPYALRFRLHRFESHKRQHIIQIDKTLASVRQPNEPLRLMRMVYAALADAESASLGAEEVGADLAAGCAAELTGWIEQIRQIHT